MNIFARLFTRKPAQPTRLVVNTYTVRKRKIERLKAAKCAQLAREIGMPWPPRHRHEAEQALMDAPADFPTTAGLV